MLRCWKLIDIVIKKNFTRRTAKYNDTTAFVCHVYIIRTLRLTLQKSSLLAIHPPGEKYSRAVSARCSNENTLYTILVESLGWVRLGYIRDVYVIYACGIRLTAYTGGDTRESTVTIKYTMSSHTHTLGPGGGGVLLKYGSAVPVAALAGRIVCVLQPGGR